MPDLFEEAVKEYLKPYIGQFNYQVMFDAQIDRTRFYPWVYQASTYREIEGATVLSSGCGSAGDLYAFLDSGVKTAHGIEVDQGLVKLANLRFTGTKYQDNVCISLYNGELLPYQDNAFDIIFSLHVLEHTQNPFIYLEELFRVLKPNGIIFMDLPSRYYFTEQHTNINYIHYFPLSVRDNIIRWLLSWQKYSDDMRYRLSTLIGYQFPSPQQIIHFYNQVKDKYNLKLLTAHFHSYTQHEIKYNYHPLIYFIGRQRRETTFRFVVQKGSQS